MMVIDAQGNKVAATEMPRVSEEPKTPKSDAARRALEEAARRRKDRDAAATPRPKEIDGRDGPDPVRYGDWEVKGIVSDF
jgi:hypothetical protein